MHRSTLRSALFMCVFVCACKAESEPMQAPAGAAPMAAADEKHKDAPSAEPAAVENQEARGESISGEPQGGAAPPPPPADPGKTAEPAKPMALDDARMPGIGDADPIIEGNLDRDIIRRVVRDHSDEVQACYDAAKRRNPTVGGTITIEFEIDKRGKVRSSTAEEGVEDEELAKCLAEAVEDWEFPEPGKGEVRVSYPFTLAPG